LTCSRFSKKGNKLFTQEQISGIIHHHGFDLFVGQAQVFEGRDEILGYSGWKYMGKAKVCQ